MFKKLPLMYAYVVVYLLVDSAMYLHLLFSCLHTYIYIYIEREREAQSKLPTSFWGILELYDTIALSGIWCHKIGNW